MMDHLVTRELEKAIFDGNVPRIKLILSFISDFNDDVKEELGLLLHDVHITVEIAQILLSHDADIRCFNNLRDSVLHSAIVNMKEPELIEVLLQHGANVNASNHRGSTPLYVALKKKFRNFDVIKLLLEYGADINILNRERRVYGYHYSALEFSLFDLKSIKFLIKHTLLRNCDGDFKKSIDLEQFKDHHNYVHVREYLQQCLAEIECMKTDMLLGNVSVCNVMMQSDEKFLWNLPLECFMSIVDKMYLRLSCNSYPIYFDVILSSKIAKICLLAKLQEAQIYTQCNTVGQIDQRIILLDLHSVFNISTYLSNLDLLSFVKASSSP